MKVVVTKQVNEDYTFESLEIVIDEATKFSVYNGESSQDNTLSQNFSDCHDIPELLKKAYLAGQRGEKFEVEYVTGDDN